MKARNLATAIPTLSVTSLLWIVRPPLHQLPAPTRLSLAGLTEYAYGVGWLLLLLASLSESRRLVRRIPSARSVSQRWLASTRPHRRSSPLALPHAAPQIMLTAHGGAEHAVRLSAQAVESSPEAAPIIESDSTRATVLLLGPLTIGGAHSQRHGLRAAALELVAYLALHPHGATRDELLEALWPDQDPGKTRGRLYQATRDARRLLGEATITRSKEHYALDRTLITVDIDQLEDALRTAERLKADERTEQLERALALVRGEPLAGSDYQWAEPHIRRFRSILVDLLARVGNKRLDSGDPVAALAAAERGLRIDTLNEELWRLALAAEGAAGLRGAVERRYRQLQTVLDDQLGLAPAHETRALYRRLLAQT
jgi:DNA-binding SARP family transcriptional activator